MTNPTDPFDLVEMVALKCENCDGALPMKSHQNLYCDCNEPNAQQLFSKDAMRRAVVEWLRSKKDELSFEHGDTAVMLLADQLERGGR